MAKKKDVKDEYTRREEMDYCAYLSALIARRIVGELSSSASKLKLLETFADERGTKLNIRMRKEADEESLSILSAYADIIAEEYDHQLENTDYSRDRGWEKVEFDPQIKEMWKLAIKNKLQLRMVYISETSGKTRRLVEPIKTTGPYGEAYCFLRKEERVFRFDRVVELEVIG